MSSYIDLTNDDDKTGSTDKTRQVRHKNVKQKKKTLSGKSRRNLNWYNGTVTPSSDDDDDDENDNKYNYKYEKMNKNISQQNEKDTNKSVNCIICCEKNANTVFIACGHQALCKECYTEYSKEKKYCVICLQQSEAVTLIPSGFQ